MTKITPDMEAAAKAMAWFDVLTDPSKRTQIKNMISEFGKVRDEAKQAVAEQKMAGAIPTLHADAQKAREIATKELVAGRAHVAEIEAKAEADYAGRESAVSRREVAAAARERRLEEALQAAEAAKGAAEATQRAAEYDQKAAKQAEANANKAKSRFDGLLYQLGA